MASAEVAEVYMETSLAAFEAFPEEFFEECILIRTPQGRVPFKLRSYQRKMLRSFLTKRYNIVLKARQLGFTTLVSAFALWLALFREDQVIDIFADKELSARKIIRMVRLAYDNMPDWVKQALPRPIKRNELMWEFDNGSTIQAFTGAKDAGRGETATLVILDEWAAYRNSTATGDAAEMAWAAIEPTIDIGGNFIGGSTAQGMENYFYTKWQAVAEDKQWARHFYPYDVVPHRDLRWWHNKMAGYEREGTPWIMAQEYPRTEEEAWVKSGMTVFDTDRLVAMEPLMVAPWFAGRIDAEFYLHEDPSGPFRIYKRPVMGCDYVLGADVAEGLERGDFSDITVILATPYSRDGAAVGRRGEIVARWRAKIDADQFGDVINTIGRYYRTALVGVEGNNHGLTTLTRLRDLGYPRIFMSEVLDQRTKKPTERMGWYTSMRTKPLVIDGLARGLRTGELVFWDDTLRREMLMFVRQPNGRLGKPNVHDDAVMSAAIAWEMMGHTYEPRYAVKDRAQPWTFKWFDEYTKAQAGSSGRKWM